MLSADLEAELRELSDEELAELLVCVVGKPRPGKSHFMASNISDSAPMHPQEGGMEEGRDGNHEQET